MAITGQNMTDEQNANILNGWNSYQNDAAGFIKAMDTYNISAENLAAATGQSADKVNAWLQANGASDGYAGANFAYGNADDAYQAYTGSPATTTYTTKPLLIGSANSPDGNDYWATTYKAPTYTNGQKELLKSDGFAEYYANRQAQEDANIKSGFNPAPQRYIPDEVKRAWAFEDYYRDKSVDYVRSYIDNGIAPPGSYENSLASNGAGGGSGGTGATASVNPGSNKAPASGSSGGTGFNLGGLQDPTVRTVNPQNETVAGQLQSVIASDNPLMQQARTRALQAQNANGTMNSTMATQASQAALYDKALQIASPDAAIYGSAADLNTNTSNQFKAADNAQQRQKEILSIQQQYNLTNMEAQNVYDMQKLTYQTQAAKDAAAIEATYKNLTQGSASATSIMNNMQSSLNQIYANTSITDAAIRDKLIKDVKGNAVSALKMIGALAGNIDIQQYIDIIGL